MSTLSFYVPPKSYMVPLADMMTSFRGGEDLGGVTCYIKAAIQLEEWLPSDGGTALTPATHVPPIGSGGGGTV